MSSVGVNPTGSVAAGEAVVQLDRDTQSWKAVMGRRTRRSRRGPLDPLTSESDAVAAPGALPRRGSARRRRRRVLLAIGVIFVSAVLFGPALIVRTPVLSWVVTHLTETLPGKVRVGSARLGWWRPIELGDLEVRESGGESLLTVRRVSWDRSLWQLLWDATDLGTITIREPTVTCRLRAGGSNLEDWLAALPVAADNSASMARGRVIVEAGTLALDGPTESTTLEELTGTLELPSADHEPLRFAAAMTPRRTDSGTLATSARGVVQLRGELRLAASSQTEPESTCRVEFELREFPLEVFGPLATRIGQTLQLEGQASGRGEVQLVLGDSIACPRVATQLHVANLRCAGPLLGDERLQLDQLEVQIDAAQGAANWHVAQALVRSELGEVQLAGELEAAAWTGRPVDLLLGLTKQPLKVVAEVDLAALSRQMPRTLRIRDDTQLHSGHVRVELHNQLTPTGPRLAGTLDVEQLVARQAGQTVPWLDSIHARLALAGHGHGWRVETVSAQAPFLQLEGQGDLERGEVKLRSDLTLLGHEIGRLFEFDPDTLAGHLQAQLSWQRDEDERWKLAGSGTGQSLAIRGPGGAMLRESNLATEFQLDGRQTGWQISTIDAGRIQLSTADQDRLSATLRQPVSPVGPATSWPLDVAVSGDLKRWRDRVQTILGGEFPELQGQFDAQAQIVAAPAQIQLQPVQLTVQNLQWSPSAGEPWLEPTVQIRAAGHYDVRSRQLACAELTLASATMSLRAQRLRWPLPTDPADAGEIQYRADLAKLWQRTSGTVAGGPTGQCEGRLQLAQREGSWAFQTTHTVERFQWLAPPARNGQLGKLVWREPRLQWLADGLFSADDCQIQLTRARLETEAMTIQSCGTVGPESGIWAADLEGQTEIHWERLTPQLRPWLGDGVLLYGQITRPFRLQGPLQTLAPSRPNSAPSGLTRAVSQSRPSSSGVAMPPGRLPRGLVAEIGGGWERAEAAGLTFGPTDVKTRLAQEVLTFDPLEIPVSDGRLRLAPQIELRAPYTLTFAKGPLADRVGITPEMCRQWLKYIAPLVADATSAEGRFSVRLARAEIPVLAPDEADIGGSLAIHSAQIGPGPLAREFLTLAQQIRTLLDPQRGSARFLDASRSWIELPEQQVPFRVEQGRVAHQNLTMQIGDVTVRTRGSVGFDQQLSLVAEIPIRDDWVADEPWLVGLRGQTLEIPIRGTVQQPQLDRRVLQNLTQQSLRGTAEGLLRQELQRQLNRLGK